MKYDQYSYLYPPRPETKIPPAMTNFYDSRGWIAQAKLNGTCTLIFTNGTDCVFKTRHNEDHKAWTPKSEHISFFNSTVSEGWNVFVAELMHSKGPELKDMLYVFDILVHAGKQLVGTTFAERQDILASLIPGVEHELWYEHNRNVVRAKNHVGPTLDLYSKITETSYVEGVVMKNPKARLDFCFKEGNNKNWQVKCRKTTKNYGF